jgi:EF hand
MKNYSIAALLILCNISLAQSPPANPAANPTANPAANPAANPPANPLLNPNGIPENGPGIRPRATEVKTPEQMATRLWQEDKNADGKLTQDELPAQLRDSFRAMDLNHDGYLDESEVLAFTKIMASREQSRGGATQNFEAAMKQINRAFKALEKSTFEESSKAKDLKSIQMIEAGLVSAKGMIATVKMAPQAKQKYGTDTAKYESDMRSQLLAALTVAIALENAVIRGDAAGAKELVSKLDAEEHEGHEMFKYEENEEKGEGEPTAPGVAPTAPIAPK